MSTDPQRKAHKKKKLGSNAGADSNWQQREKSVAPAECRTKQVRAGDFPPACAMPEITEVIETA